jgi:uncharacterized protein (DUF697 family)
MITVLGKGTLMGNDEGPTGESAIMKVVKWILSTGVDGIGPLSSSEGLATEYRVDRSYQSTADRVNAMIRWEAAKSFGTGFVTGLPGILALPVTIPSGLYASWMIQGRLAGAVASLYGYATEDDRVRTLILLTLMGDSGKEFLNDLGVQVGKRIAQKAIDHIPGRVLIDINTKVGFQLITKGGQRGLVNLTKAIPLIGGVVGGGIDAAACYAVGKTAKSIFGAPDEGGEGDACSTVP